VADSASTLDPIVAARIAALEAMVAEQQAELDEKHAELEAEQAAHLATKAERDRLREAYDALVREVELARRRLVVAKAERVDTAQLELVPVSNRVTPRAETRFPDDDSGNKASGASGLAVA